jgi:hypothetical protein
MPIPSLPQFNPARIRSYILRLPFCTKVLVAAILGLWIATVPFPGIREFGRLEPAKMDLTQSMCFLLWLRERKRWACDLASSDLRSTRIGESEEPAELTLRALEHTRDGTSHLKAHIWI